MRYIHTRKHPQLPHSARSVELIEPLRQLCGYGRYESEAAGGVQEGAEEPARLQAGLLSRREQASSLSSPSPGCWGTCDDPGLVYSDDVCGAVAAGAADLVAGPAGQVRQADRPDVGADLFAGLPDPAAAGGSPASTAPPGTSRPSSWPAWRAGSTRPAPPPGRTGTGGTGSSSCPATARSLAACAAIPAWVKSCGPGAGQQPGLPRAGRITGPDGARAGLFAAG